MNTISYTGGIDGREIFPEKKLTETQWLKYRYGECVYSDRERGRGRVGDDSVCDFVYTRFFIVVICSSSNTNGMVVPVTVTEQRMPLGQ